MAKGPNPVTGNHEVMGVFSAGDLVDTNYFDIEKKLVPGSQKIIHFLEDLDTHLTEHLTAKGCSTSISTFSSLAAWRQDF